MPKTLRRCRNAPITIPPIDPDGIHHSIASLTWVATRPTQHNRSKYAQVAPYDVVIHKDEFVLAKTAVKPQSLVTVDVSQDETSR